MKKYPLSVSGENVNLILTGLGKLPAELSFDLIKEIHAAVAEETKSDKLKADELKEKEFQERFKIETDESLRKKQILQKQVADLAKKK